MRELPADGSERSRTLAPQAFEHGTRVVCRDRDGPLSARLTLHRMSLVDDPMANGRQDLSLRRDVSKKQGVIGHDHIRACRPPPSSVHKAGIGKEGAEPAGALARTCGEVLAIHALPANPQRIEVSARTLTRESVDHRDRRQRVRRIAVGLNLRRAAGEPLELAQTGIMVEPFERAVRDASLDRVTQLGQFVVHELVGEVVRLRRDTYRDVVLLRRRNEGNQVGDGLSPRPFRPR